MGRADGGIHRLRELLAENPEWESDLLALYGFDIWDAIDGRVPIRRAFSYLARLPHEPKSLWRAEKMGGPEHYGWDYQHYLLADIADGIMMSNAIATHSGKGPLKAPEPTYRPKANPDKEIKAPEPKSLDDFDVKALLAQMGTG